MKTGIVNKVGTKDVTTKFGTKKTYSLNVDGDWYSCGFKDHKASEGDLVEFEYSESTYGKQIDMSTFKKAAGERAPAASSGRPPSYGGKGVFPIPALDGQRSIVRQNALTNAREMVMARLAASLTKTSDWSGMDNEHLADSIIATARRFEAYTAGDLDLAEAQAEMDA